MPVEREGNGGPETQIHPSWFVGDRPWAKAQYIWISKLCESGVTLQRGISNTKQIFKATIFTPFLMWINALRLTCFIKFNSELSCDVLCGGYSDISHCSPYITKSKDTSLRTGLTTKDMSHGGTPWLVQGLMTCGCASLGLMLLSVFMLLLG